MSKSVCLVVARSRKVTGGASWNLYHLFVLLRVFGGGKEVHSCAVSQETSSNDCKSIHCVVSCSESNRLLHENGFVRTFIGVCNFRFCTDTLAIKNFHVPSACDVLIPAPGHNLGK